MVFTLPNLLTFFRLLVAPLFFFLYSNHLSYETSLILLALLVLAEGTDLLDGFLARRWGQVTDFGKILDPFADSLYRISVLLTLTLPPVSLPVYLILIFLYRESSISTLRTLVALRGVALHARLSGKIKAVLQGFAIIFITCLLCLETRGVMELETLQTISNSLTTVVAFYSLFSGIEYLMATRKN